MAIAKKIEGFMEKSSWIRKMFEEGAKLKAAYGAENVFDFSLGNPYLKPPGTFDDVLHDVAADNANGVHAYMPNVGLPATRQAVAAYLSGEQGIPVSENDVVMTCGAAGALNVIFKALLDPEDEVLVPAPYFVEYGFYADNHGGVLKTVPTNADFTLNLTAMEAAITPKTKIVLINSPNNPTGQIYSRDSLDALGRILTEKSASLGRPIFLVSDEPYRKIIFDGAEVPSIFTAYANAIVATSYSKDISIPGERIGYLAVSPRAADQARVLGGIALANRILGFVNAPALMQRVIARVQGQTVDISAYATKRQLLCDGLAALGYEFVMPKGAFYLFPKAPGGDDVAFVQALQEERVLAVPGTGFGAPGYFRIAFCVGDDTIVAAMPAFGRAIEKFK